MLTGSNNVFTWCLLVGTQLDLAIGIYFGWPIPLLATIYVAGIILSLSPRMVRDWERGVSLRLGKFNCVLQPGISWIVPGIDMISARVDMRVRSTSFSAEKH